MPSFFKNFPVINHKSHALNICKCSTLRNLYGSLTFCRTKRYLHSIVYPLTNQAQKNYWYEILKIQLMLFYFLFHFIFLFCCWLKIACCNEVSFRSSHRRYSVRKGVLRNFAKFTGKHLRQSLLIKKETVAQVFFCEFCEISKNTFFIGHLWVTASVSLSWTKKFNESMSR